MGNFFFFFFDTKFMDSNWIPCLLVVDCVFLLAGLFYVVRCNQHSDYSVFGRAINAFKSPKTLPKLKAVVILLRLMG